MKRIIFALVFFAASVAQAQQVDCAKFSAAIDSDLRKLSSGALAGRSSELGVASVAATNINSNLLIMQAAKCKLPSDPISSSYYLSDAFACGTAESSGNRNEMLEKCTTSKWGMRKQQQQ